MYLKKLLFSVTVLYCGFVGENYAASQSSQNIEIITLGIPTETLAQAPFAERISFYPSYALEENEKNNSSVRSGAGREDNDYDAETATCSIFVGTQSALPDTTTIAFISDNDEVYKYQKKSPPGTLHLINLAEYDALDGFSAIVRGIGDFATDLFGWDFKNSPGEAHAYLEIIAESRKEIEAHSGMVETFRTLFHQTFSSLQE